jgi:putative transposase
MQLGVGYLFAKKFKEALDHFHRSVEMFNVTYASLFGMAGAACWCMNKPEAAVKEWQSGLKVGGITKTCGLPGEKKRRTLGVCNHADTVSNKERIRHMGQNTGSSFASEQGEPGTLKIGCASRDALHELIRKGAQEMIAQALQEEVGEYLERHAQERDDAGHRLVVRNGYKEPRQIVTGVGAVAVRQPRVDDRRTDEQGRRERFESKLLPPYLRRAKSVDELVPWLYLKGISTGDMSEALQSLLGPGAGGLSATNVVRLKELWTQEHESWSKRSLTGKHYVYFWADGIHFNIRLEEDRQCILVIIGATADGEKELVAVHDGVRESEQSWKEVLLDLKSRGLAEAPQLAIGDGALGFWKALPQVFGRTRAQRCWVHKTANVLNYLPRGLQSKAKGMLHEIWMAPTKAAANKAFDLFLETYRAKYPKAAECLAKDRDALLAFYDFPAEHWSHIRTTNPIESTFAGVRLRTGKTKGSGTRAACLAMVFKLAQSAENSWRALNGSALLPEVIQGVRFIDGVRALAA